MLYHLFDYLDSFDFPGAGMFQYISFRTSMAILLSLVITMVFGGNIIRFIQKKQIGEDIRDLGLDGQMQKKGTPTMGGIMILGSILIPTLLFARLDNIYIWMMIITTIWLGMIGFLDDYIKVFKKDKEGLAGKFKIVGQVTLGLIIAFMLYKSDQVVVREAVLDTNGDPITEVIVDSETGRQHVETRTQDVRSTKTTIPFIKNQEFDYKNLLFFMSKENQSKWVWLIYAGIIIFIITAVSNSTNLTDGIDGLAAGTTAISGVTLGVLTYVSGHIILSDYLNIMYIPNVGELSVFIGAFVGATMGFLWYNAYPAQIFMGDTGSLALGGIIAVLAIIIRKELMIPLFCAIFLFESISVIMQVSWFKHTKKKYGEGRRVFLMTPIHHHYQKKGMKEPKIVTRFWIVAIGLAIFSVITLKIR